MKILLVLNQIIPVHLYGGTERVVWDLGKALHALGHEVTFLAPEGSSCPFAKVIHFDPHKNLGDQIHDTFDVVHVHCAVAGLESLQMPYVITFHGNAAHGALLDKNTIFVSKNHAQRYASLSFVHNGMDWDQYPKPDLTAKQTHFHFLGKAAWRVKNVQGAIDVVKLCPKAKLQVMGGYRFNFKMGMRFTFNPKIKFAGMVGNDEKSRLMSASKGLIFPVKWHEPFGLAIVESLYYGCPIFATPYGALPELVSPEMGVLSNKKEVLALAAQNYQDYSRADCHAYARDVFNSQQMALAYLAKYEQVANGYALNDTEPSLVEMPDGKYLDWR